ncbi:calponin [Balamuthia mandrillaris]
MPKEFDPKRAAEARQWIESVTGEQFASEDFVEALKSGVLLCKLVNALKPGTIRTINTSSMPFKQMENIAAYINATRDMGVPDRENFMTVDLYESKDLAQVVQNILSLKRATGHGFERESPAQISLQTEVNSSSGFDRSTLSATPTKLGEGGRYTGQAYQPGHSENTQTFTCCVCTKFITSGCIDACGKKWHPSCFDCKRCGTRLASGKYYEHEAKPYCEKCVLIVNPSNKRVQGRTTDKGFAF